MREFEQFLNQTTGAVASDLIRKSSESEMTAYIAEYQRYLTDRDDKRPSNEPGDIMVPIGTYMAKNREELGEFTGLHTNGAGPCVVVSIRLKHNEQAYQRYDVVALAHFDGENKPSDLHTMYKEVIEKARSDGYKVDINLAGGRAQGAKKSAEGSLNGPDLFHGLSEQAKSIKDDRVTVSERHTKMSDEEVDARVSADEGFKRYAKIAVPEGKTDVIRNTPIARQAFNVTLKDSKRLATTTGGLDSDTTQYFENLKISLEEADKPPPKQKSLKSKSKEVTKSTPSAFDEDEDRPETDMRGNRI